MKKNITQYIITIFIAALTVKAINCDASTTNNSNPINKTMLYDANSFMFQKNQLDNYMKTYDTLPKGWKQYFRAQAFWQRHLMPDGGLVTPKLLVNELQKVLNENQTKQKKQTEKLLAENKWEALGPFTPPSRFGNGRVNCVTVDIENDSIIWIGSASGGIWRSKDKGQNWEVIPFTDMLSTGVTDIAISPSNPNIMYATTGEHHAGVLYKSFSLGVLKSVDRGNSWEILSKTLDFADSIAYSRLLIHPNNPNIVYVGTTQSILKTTDGGNSWTPIIEGHYFRDLEFKPNNPNVIYATTMLPWSVGGSKLFMSVDAGENWEMMKEFPEARRMEMTVTPASPESLYLLTGYYHTHSGLEGLYIARKNCTEWDTIMNRSTQTNFRDFVYSQAFYNLTVGVSPSDTNLILIGGVYLGYSTDGGKTWTQKTSTHVDHHAIIFVDSLIYCANDGGLNVISQQGLQRRTENWRDLSDGLSITQYYRIGVHPYTTKLLLAGSQDNGTHLYNEGNWRHYSGGDGMECQFNPKRPREIKTTTQRAGAAMVGERSGWVTLFVISPLTPDTTLIGAANIWAQYDVYDEEKEEYVVFNEKLSDFPDADFPNEIIAIAISPTDKNYIYASTFYRLFYTNDYGKNWQEVYNSLPTVSYIAVSDTDPELFWASHSGHFAGEKISEFRNGIRKNISYNLPNISINTIVYYPTAKTLFIGTDFGVFKLEDNSQEWQLFNDGMPNVCISELEYVPTTGYLYAASWGRGVWKIKLEENNVIEPKISVSGRYVVCEYDLPFSVYNVEKQDGYRYFWCNGSTDDSLQINSAGQYYLVGISPAGHSEISQILTVEVARLHLQSHTVMILPPLDQRNPACIGDTLVYVMYAFMLDSAFAPYSFEWSNGSRDNAVRFTDSAEVSITFTNAFGCFSTYIVDTARFASYLPTPQIRRYKNLLICEDSAYNYQWKIDGHYTNIMTNFIEVKSAGIYEVIVRNEHYCATVSEEFLIEMPDDEASKLIQARISPNPNPGKFNLELLYSGVDDVAEDIKLRFFDSNGRLLAGYSVLLNGYYYDEFDFSNYAIGAYFLELTVKNYSRTISFIIEK